MSGFFVTGTDTEIGKTFVSSLLIRQLVDKGLRVSGMKPIASDAKNINGVLQNEDALALMQASNVDLPYELVNPYVFEPAISPHIAAAERGIEINLQKIKTNFDSLEKKSDVVVVEAVGGWYAPLNEKQTVADLAKCLNQPIILVVGLRLGCLNHTALTLEAIKNSGLPIAGWVANQVDPSFPYVDENISTLKQAFNDIPLLGFIPYLDSHKKNKKNVINSSRVKQGGDLKIELLL